MISLEIDTYLEDHSAGLGAGDAHVGTQEVGLLSQNGQLLVVSA